MQNTNWVVLSRNERLGRWGHHVRFLSCAALWIALLADAEPGFTQTTSGAQNLQLTPDARAQGMGRAFTAVAEGATAQWWNPGALALQRDRIYVNPFSYSKLVPDLADNVWWYHSGAVADFGPYGVGAHFRRLSYGESSATDAEGKNLRTFTSSEYTLYLGAGVNLVEVFAPELTGFQLGIGANWKHARVDLAPAWATTSGKAGKGNVTDLDFGVLGKTGRRFENGKVIVSAGWTLKNALDQEIEYGGQNQRDPIFRSARIGVAASVALGESPLFGDLFAATVSFDADDQPSDNTTIKHTGIEVTGLGIFSVRYGKINDPDGDVVDNTTGFGVGFSSAMSPKGTRFGFSIDRAEVPQASGLDRVNHTSGQFWLQFP